MSMLKLLEVIRDRPAAHQQRFPPWKPVKPVQANVEAVGSGWNRTANIHLLACCRVTLASTLAFREKLQFSLQTLGCRFTGNFPSLGIPG